MPVPQYTPMRLRSADARSRALEASASAAAASANCDTRSRLAASFAPISARASQSTSAPTSTLERCAISGGRRRMPERALASASVNCAQPLPIGETTPAPVMATRRIQALGLAGACEQAGEVALEGAKRPDVLQVLVRDADAELRFHLEHEIDEAQRIDAEG